MRFWKRHVAAFALAACAPACLAGCTSKSATTGATGSASPSPTRPDKPAAERIPVSKMLTVSLLPSTAVPAARDVVVTDAPTIARVAGDINALPTAPLYPGAYACPEMTGPELTLDFRDSSAGPVLAEVLIGRYPSGICSLGVQVTIGGTREPSLDDSGRRNFLAELEQLVGITASANTGTPSATATG